MKTVSYDIFTAAFLSKVSEFDLLAMEDTERTETVDGYMKRAIADFRKNCKYDFSTTADDTRRQFDVEVPDEDMDELVQIISEGMLVQWMKPVVYRQEIMENILTTRDFSAYSPAELLRRVREAYDLARRDFIQMVREYSFNHGDLTELHL